MSWNLVTFAYGGKLFNIYQDYISSLATQNGLNAFKYSPEDLEKTDVYKENKEYFIEDNKYGWCAWKPLMLLEAMKSCDEGDKLVLCDTEDVLHPHLFPYVDQTMGDDPCLLVVGNDLNKTSTKRDCFVYMECDDGDYWNSRQLEAGITFWQVCDQAKEILEEWLKWCLDERVNGEDSNYSGKGNFPDFNGYSSKDQGILTNMAVRDGLSVDDGTIRNWIECNADYWYERNQQSGFTMNRPVDQYMKQIEENCPYANHNSIKHSLILTVHNKEWLIEKVVKGITDNTTGNYELIFVFDGCEDNSAGVALNAADGAGIDYKVLTAPNVFETKANNIGLKEATGDLAIIIQDDMVIEEKGWNRRMQKPFMKFDDVFAVTARTAHNYTFNPNSQHVNMQEDLDHCWCDILQSCDEADRTNTPRDTFAVRSTVNRGPLMIDLDELKKLNYLDEEYSPQDMDDHDLMYRAWKELKKVCGCYWIKMRSDTEWGGTRAASGGREPAPWLYKAQHKNSKIFYGRNKDVLDDRRIVVNRKVS